MKIKKYISKGRELANDKVREYGNKIKPHVFTEPISSNEYGLGDILTYKLHAGHARAAIGAGTFGLFWYGVCARFNPISMILISPIAIPTMLAGGSSGYAGAIAGYSISASKKEKKEQLNLDTISKKDSHNIESIMNKDTK